ARGSLAMVRDLALVALVAMVGTYAGITLYTRMSAPDATTTPVAAPSVKPSAQPQRLAAATDEPAIPPAAAAPAGAAAVPATTTAALATQSPPPGPPVRGVTDTEIKFGIAAALSGPAKELGRQMKQGIDTAFGVVNAAGGINGRQLRLIGADDG